MRAAPVDLNESMSGPEIKKQAVRMFCHRNCGAVVVAALMLAGCSSADDLWPTLTGDEPDEVIVVGPSAAEQDSPVFSPTPPPSYTPTMPAPTMPMGATGTFVGAKVAQHAQELETLKASMTNDMARFQQLRAITEQNAQRYYAIVAAINARLQIGTTPGNPVLVSQWNTAQSELDRILTDIAALNTLANDVAAKAAMSGYLLESIRAAYGLSGAVDEDHRQLARVEDEVNRTIVLIDRLLGELNDTVSRQTSYANNERRHLTTLSLGIKNGQMFGPQLANSRFSTSIATHAHGAVSGGALGSLRQPLVVIRFDRPDVPYEQALYSAISQVLGSRPSAAFDIVAYTANSGTPAEVVVKSNLSKRNAEEVFRSLSEMGLPGDRMTLSAAISTTIQTNEVHVYVR